MLGYSKLGGRRLPAGPCIACFDLRCCILELEDCELIPVVNSARHHEFILHVPIINKDTAVTQGNLGFSIQL